MHPSLYSDESIRSEHSSCRHRLGVWFRWNLRHVTGASVVYPSSRSAPQPLEKDDSAFCPSPASEHVVREASCK